MHDRGFECRFIRGFVDYPRKVVLQLVVFIDLCFSELIDLGLAARYRSIAHYDFNHIMSHKQHGITGSVKNVISSFSKVFETFETN